MLNSLLKRSLVFGIVIMLFSICFTTFSHSSSVSESNISTNNDNTTKYGTARIILFYSPEYEYDYSNADIGFGFGTAGPFGFLGYGFGWYFFLSILIINGTITVTPLNSPKLTLNSGDKVSMITFFVFEIDDNGGNGIAFLRAFGVTIEKT